MGKGKTVIQQPERLDIGQEMRSYIDTISDPELQAKILEAERIGRPQYTALELADQEAALFGTGGQEGLLGMQARAAEFAGQQDTLQKQREMDQLRQFGPEYTAAVRAADPEAFEAAQATRGLADTFAEDRAGVMGAVGDIEAETARAQAQLAQERAGIEGTIGDIQSATARAETAFDEDIAGFRDAQARALEDRAGFQEQAKGFQDQAKAFQAEADRLGVDVENLDPRVDMLSQLSADEAQRLASEASVDDPRLTKLQALQQKQAETLYSESEGRLSAERAREAEQAARMAGAARGRVGDASTMAQELLGRESSRARLREEARQAGSLGFQQASNIGQLRSQRARDAMAAGQLGFGMQTGAESMRQGRRGQALQTAGLGLQAGGLGLQAGGQGLQAGQQALQSGQLGMAGREAGIQAGRLGRQQELAARQLGLGATQAGATLGLQGQQMGLSARQLGSQLGQAQQGALGQAFNQFRATAGDPTAFLFGRPSLSGSLGTQAYGQAYNLAGQQMGPQLYDPNMGINLAMQQRSQDFSLMGAQAQADAANRAGGLGALGSIGGAILGGPAGGFASKLFGF
jgi:hypothetical protein